MDLRPPALPELASARAGLTRGPGNAAAAAFDAGIGDAKAVDPAAGTATPETFRRFEAMVLQTFIQNMLPKEGAAVYGKGVAGEMWKSLLAEKVAGVMAERGDIGIADRMLGARYAPEAVQSRPAVQPSTAVEAADSASLTRSEYRPQIAPAVLDGMQRSLSELLTGDVGAPPETAVHSTTTKRG